MKDRYNAILKQNSDLWKAVSAEEYDDPFGLVASRVISPVILLYTLWILDEAEKQGLKRLYFLARDGYQMYHIAEEICRKRRNGIVCSYFCCSRYALRMAAYRFFDESAYERLFLCAYSLSACSLLRRAGLDKEEQAAVYADIAFPQAEEHHVLGRRAFADLCGKVGKSAVFREILTRKSDAAYAGTIAYIRQEQIQNYDTVGIVDLGWTGSLQATLRRLLDSDHIGTKIVGFYMGMLTAPPQQPSSQYRAWLFDEKELMIRAWFAHNLMECICSAPHGMTMGYRRFQGKVSPVFKEQENPKEPVEYLCSMTRRMLHRYGEKAVYQPQDRWIALHLLQKLMLSPTKQEALALSQYRFCDDVGEQYHRTIVQTGEPQEYQRELLFWKPFYMDSSDGFYWYCGSVAASKLVAKPVYRYAYLFTKVLIMKWKRR